MTSGCDSCGLLKYMQTTAGWNWPYIARSPQNIPLFRGGYNCPPAPVLRVVIGSICRSACVNSRSISRSGWVGDCELVGSELCLTLALQFLIAISLSWGETTWCVCLCVCVSVLEHLKHLNMSRVTCGECSVLVLIAGAVLFIPEPNLVMCMLCWNPRPFSSSIFRYVNNRMCIYYFINMYTELVSM